MKKSKKLGTNDKLKWLKCFCLQSYYIYAMFASHSALFHQLPPTPCDACRLCVCYNIFVSPFYFFLTAQTNRRDYFGGVVDGNMEFVTTLGSTNARLG